MSKVRIRGAGGRRNVRLCRMQQRVPFSDMHALTAVMVFVAELLVTGDRVPASWCHDPECLGFEINRFCMHFSFYL